MKKIKNLIIPIIFILIVIFPTMVSSSQSNSPIFTVQSVSSQKSSISDLQTHLPLPYSGGNIIYLLTIDATFVFPQNTPFTGYLNMSCGLYVSLVNTTAWKVINLEYYCPAIFQSMTQSAGTYHSSLQVYISTIKNYTNSNYPENIGFYIASTLNKRVEIIFLI